MNNVVKSLINLYNPIVMRLNQIAYIEIVQIDKRIFLVLSSLKLIFF